MSLEDIVNLLKKKHGKKYKKELRELYEGQLFKKNFDCNFKKALLYHRSSKERYNFYDTIYKKLEPYLEDEIIDLGCGLNPFSIVFMKKKPKKYYAIDINEDIIRILNNCKKEFKAKGVELEAIKHDAIFDLKTLEINSKSSTIFLFKNP